MAHRTHWINGKPWTGEAAIRGEIYNPATGRVSGTVDYAAGARSTRRWRGRVRSFVSEIRQSRWKIKLSAD